MRTLTAGIRKIEEALSLLTNHERRYQVKGEIVFVFRPASDHIDLDSLRRQIKEVDALFPWKENQVPEGAEEPSSIFYLGDGQITNPYSGEKHVWFTIHPRYDNMRKGQLYAYEKYLAKLAEELTKPRPFEIWPESVRSVITIKAAMGFKLLPSKIDVADKSTSLNW